MANDIMAVSAHHSHHGHQQAVTGHNHGTLKFPTSGLNLSADLMLKRAIAGGFAGSCCILTSHPFDTVKVRMQIDNTSKNHFRHNGIFKPGLRHKIRRDQRLNYKGRFRNLSSTYICARNILRNEGVAGFYKGMLFPLLSSIPWTASVFVGYTVGEQLFDSRSGLPPEQFSNKKALVAGCTAGLVNTFVACPVERVNVFSKKRTIHLARAEVSTVQFGIPTSGFVHFHLGTQAQASTPSYGHINKSTRYRGPFDCAYKVYQDSGLFYGNFKGFGITLLRRTPSYAVYFIVFENIKQLCRKRKQNSNISQVEILLAGGTAGVVSASFCIVPDTIKTRLQAAHPGQYPHGVRSVIREMIQRREPLTNLFRGLPPLLMRAFPACATYMFAYEAFLKYWYNETHLLK